MSSSHRALAVRDLGKAYTIRHNASDHITLSELALHRLRHPFQRSSSEQFWALRDLTFDVAQGEVLGLIGGNGAGKSTLLKLVSRITGPTTGEIALWGRVGSLLEVGTGFHPELTGRENIYLNGSILGMNRAEIDGQFDAIVDFAGVERFLDTPVKRYSSGMYVRLAFAVAAHLESEILLVDEVLAVGDQEFQRKCLDKMRSVATTGKTVLFVSHQLPSVRSICDRALVLAAGEQAFLGDVEDAIEHHTSLQVSRAAAPTDPDAREGTGEIRVVDAAPADPVFTCTGEKVVRFTLERRGGHIDRCFVGLILRNDEGHVLAHVDSNTAGCWYDVTDRTAGEFRLTHPWLYPGRYTVDLYACNAGPLDKFEGACTFTVSETMPYPMPPDELLLRRDPVLHDFSFSVRREPTSPPAAEFVVDR